jgi:hypothetical protein
VACQTLNMERGRIDDELRDNAIGSLHLCPTRTASPQPAAPAKCSTAAILRRQRRQPSMTGRCILCQRHGNTALHRRLAQAKATAREMTAGERKVDGKPGLTRRCSSRCLDNPVAGAKPYTLHPTPPTLNPKPYTLHPAREGQVEEGTRCEALA